jgi:hypothetical protein
MRTRLVLVVVPLLVLVALPSAAAQTCVAVDVSRDTLSEAERRAALTLLAQNLQQNGMRVVASGCTATFTLAHVRFGNAVTVFLSGPSGSRQATAQRLEDVPNLYAQMVRSLVSGQPMSTANDSVDRKNVTTEQLAPARVAADSLWYVRLGYGLVLRGEHNRGPAFGFGYRYELDSVAIDASFLNLMVASDGGGEGDAALNGSWIKLMGLYFLNPQANSSLYLGAGLSWGATGLAREGAYYSGTGLQVETSLGYELLRASTIRLFLQADALLPLYDASLDLVASGSGQPAALWAPSLVVSLGAAWGRGHGAVVRVLE